MKKITFYRKSVKNFLAFTFVLLTLSFQSVFGQVSLTASGGTASGSFATLNDAFVAINAGTHTGAIVISVNGNTTEPAAPVYLLASGQGTTSFTSVLIKPTVVATISGATNAGSAVINLDGADNVTIDGSIATGGTTRDLTIQNTAASTIANVACIRLIGRTTLGLGTTNTTISNCNIIGNTPGNNGLSGSTVTTTYGIYAGSAVLTTMAATSGGADYDDLVINNNAITNAYIGVNIIGLTANPNNNINISNNTIGSLTNRIGFKGIIGNFLVGGSITNNMVRDIEATSFISVAGIEVGGAATNGVQIRRNTVSEIRNFNTGGYGAYGINIVAGTGVVVANNAVSGVQTLNYTVGTTFNAFGIRLQGGTGHQIYYNSVNMYGAYTLGNTTNAFSAAFCVTSTAVTGLDIRNNVFANKMTSTATSPEFLAVSFPASYNFLNATLERNAYMVSLSAQHYVGKIGTTAGTTLYSNLTAWRAISQVNNATNDVNSMPGAGNANAPFTSDTDLSIPNATVSVLESTALPIASLGLPNVDRTNLTRPAFGGTNPDMGAYEFNGSQPGDLVPPAVSGVSVTPGASCVAVSHVVTATITDNIGVTAATLSYSFGGVAQTPITMTLTSGTALNGTYTATIPAASAAAVNVMYSVQASDAIGNNSPSVSGPSYTDNYLIVTASADVSINSGSSTTMTAGANNGAFNQFMISEIVQFKNGAGDVVGNYPAYIPTTDNDFIEIINFRTAPFDASGYTMTLLGGVNGSFTIPSGAIVPSGGVLTLAFAATTNSPANNYYGMGLLSTSSGVALGYVLRDANGSIVDVVATNGYTFLPASGVTAADWSGNIPSSSGAGGVRRTAAVDNNTAANWTVTSATVLTNIGNYNTEIPITPFSAIMTWTNSANATTSTNNPLTVTFPTAGVFTYTATYSDGTCSASDNVIVTVTTPTPPVANFSGTPLALAAGGSVAFTDLSTNIPSSWAWVVAPTTGVTYISGTSATSQNPIVQFANAGVYTITLTAANVSGSDDTTRLQYIVVSPCASGATNGGDTDIGNVTFGTLNNGSALPVFSNPAATGTFSDFTALPAQTFELGQSYPISLSQITSGTTFYNAHFNVFIDYNNDGAFDPITERVFNAATSNLVPTSTVTGSVIIPTTATLGNVRMRVRLEEGSDGTANPCGTFAWGETEDYIINIVCPSVTPTTVSACGSYVWAVNGQTYTASGTYTSAVGTCPPSTLNLTINSNSTATVAVSNCTAAYTWPINGATYTASGTYVDTIPNAAGCDSIVTLNLTISPLPTAVAGMDTSVCAGGTITLTGATDGTSVSWNNGISNGVAFTPTATTTFFMTAVNAAGCQNTDSVVVTVNSLPTANAGADITVCTGTSVVLTGTSNGTVTWNNGVIDGVGFPALVGVTDYIMTAASAAGCILEDTVVVTGNALPIVDAGFTSLTICSGGSVTLNATGAPTLVWSNGVANGVPFVPTVQGVYTVVGTSANGCSASDSLTISLNSLPVVTAIALNATTLTATPTGAASYKWIDCATNIAIPSATNVTYTATVDGSYAVLVTDANGCEDTSDCVVLNAVGINEMLGSIDVQLFPNPTTGIVNVRLNSIESVNAIVYDAQGKLISTLTGLVNGSVIDLNTMDRGMYMIQLTAGSGTMIQRVVKN